MSPPRYRTLDGDEVELPLPMDRWVVVPRALARFDPELAWALDYDDAPEPEDADPRLDFSAGALLVPVERWNEHAELEPNLAACEAAPTGGSLASRPSSELGIGPSHSGDFRGRSPRRGVAVAHMIVVAIAMAAIGYVIAVGGWLWTLRDGISGPDVSTGAMLVGAAVLLAWLVGFAGAASRSSARRRRRSWPDLAVAVLHMTEDPLGILRAGLALQLTGFAVLLFLR
jgi:hypothetical protein